jgi:hypothetical protein
VDTERIMFLVVGVVIVVALGQLIALSGRRYLAKSVPAEGASAGSSAILVAVMFHLVNLGIVALLSVVGFGSNPVTGFVLRIGILMLVLAATYGLALSMLNRRRQDALAADLETNGPSEARPVVRPGDPADPARVTRP